MPVGARFSSLPMDAGKKPMSLPSRPKARTKRRGLSTKSLTAWTLGGVRLTLAHPNAGAGTIDHPVSVEFSQQLLVHMEFFREEFGCAGIGQLLERGLLLEIVGDLGNERSPHVLGRDDVLAHHRLGRARGELRPGRRVKLAALVDPVLLLERAQRIDEISTRAAIDGSGRKAGAVKQHLRRNQDGARFLGLRARKVEAVDGGKGQFTRRCWASQNSGGEHEKRKSEPRGRPGTGWIARVDHHDKSL